MMTFFEIQRREDCVIFQVDSFLSFLWISMSLKRKRDNAFVWEEFDKQLGECPEEIVLMFWKEYFEPIQKEIVRTRFKNVLRKLTKHTLWIKNALNTATLQNGLFSPHILNNEWVTHRRISNRQYGYPLSKYWWIEIDPFFSCIDDEIKLKRHF